MRDSRVHTSGVRNDTRGWPMDSQPQAHFHIRWDSGRIDWEPFNSREEADRRAKEIVLTREIYSIDEFDSKCQLCKAWRATLVRAKSPSSN